MTLRLLNDDPRCQRQDNCRATSNLCLECSKAAGVYKAAARKGNADPTVIARKREAMRQNWSDPEQRSYRLACIARERAERSIHKSHSVNRVP